MLSWLYYNIVWLLFRPLNKCLCLILKLWPSPQWSLTYTAVDVGLLVMMIWLELCTAYSSSGPFFTTTSIILCFNEHRLTQVHLEGRRKKAVKERERDRQSDRHTAVIVVPNMWTHSVLLYDNCWFCCCSLNSFRTRSVSRWPVMHWQNAFGFLLLSITRSFGNHHVTCLLCTCNFSQCATFTIG